MKSKAHISKDNAWSSIAIQHRMEQDGYACDIEARLDDRKNESYLYANLGNRGLSDILLSIDAFCSAYADEWDIPHESFFMEQLQRETRREAYQYYADRYWMLKETGLHHKAQSLVFGLDEIMLKEEVKKYRPGMYKPYLLARQYAKILKMHAPA